MRSLLVILCCCVVAILSAIPENLNSYVEGKFLARITGDVRSRLTEISDIVYNDFDTLKSRDAIDVWVNDDAYNRLIDANFQVTKLENQPEAMLKWLQQNSPKDNPLLEYHDYNELTAFLQQYHALYPNITEIFSLGLSVSGREMWGMRITDNPSDRETDEPEFIYIANIHGDETVGRELMINLIIYFTENYGSNVQVTQLVDTTDIYIIPSVNPDGFERARRQNDNGYDLNRDFPDHFTDPNNSPAGRQIETRNVMAFHEAHNFVLGANLHGGAICANYPYDGLANEAQCGRAISYSPDHDLYVDLSLTYSMLNPTMYNSREFAQGITNGAEWYCVYGGLQDYTYVYLDVLHVTLELSNIKYPPAGDLADFWEENRESLIAYLAKVHQGVKGKVYDAATHNPLKANINISRLSETGMTQMKVQTVSHVKDAGAYFRVLQPGSYAISAEVEGYQTVSKIFHVFKDQPDRKSVV